mgnify:CR=1 FL=1
MIFLVEIVSALGRHVYLKLGSKFSWLLATRVNKSGPNKWRQLGIVSDLAPSSSHLLNQAMHNGAKIFIKVLVEIVAANIVGLWLPEKTKMGP